MFCVFMKLIRTIRVVEAIVELIFAGGIEGSCDAFLIVNRLAQTNKNRQKYEGMYFVHLSLLLYDF